MALSRQEDEPSPRLLFRRMLTMISPAVFVRKMKGADGEALLRGLMPLLVALPLVLFVLYPMVHILGRSFQTPEGAGFGNYISVMGTSRFLGLVYNSFAVTLMTTGITLILAYVYAYAIQRTRIPFKNAFRLFALIPVFAPSLVQAQGLVLLLGRNGLINRTFGTDFSIYGYWGIVIASVLYVFPYAFLIFSASLAMADNRLYESSRILGAGSVRTFLKVTLPSTRFAVMASGFVVFTLVMTDFGNPMVIGGDYSVLATEVYNQVIGQANFEMGAVIGMVLLLPVALAVALEKWLTGGRNMEISDRAQPLRIQPHLPRDLAFGSLVLPMASVIIAVVGVVIFASFTHLWPYRMEFSLRHYNFDVQNGIAPLWNSIYIGLMAAGIGVIAAGLGAWVTERCRTFMDGPLYFLCIAPAAIPGMVLGLGYVLAFNHPSSPLAMLYGSLLLLAVCNVYHYHAQGFLIASTSMKQIAGTYDEASAALGGSFIRTLRKITLPLMWPTLVGVAVFFFMRSMVTLSAVIFLITPSTQVAAVSVLMLEDRGAVNQAAAFSVCIMAVVVGVLLVARLLLNAFGYRHISLIR
ncbi:iron(III) transport system permease protein [Desulfobotulus alkaliphilus]|uniref:Iron(III) transport system permease protein n=1 Tax=Desulfobotulus alkaliphilus TaxID=622671 RepID=A0A562RY65_9BACT|nr:ABC transporter permease subunit [Desulfobotulus alkaliphilus]TWI73991.1 iron(III) transport system permease protein [Desulfobotulus alkaliphilus]